MRQPSPGDHAADLHTPLAVDWTDDTPRVIPVCPPDLDHLDTFADELREALAHGHDLTEILARRDRERDEAQHRESLLEGVRLCLGEIIDSPQPKRTCCALVFLSGMELTRGQSGPQLARKFGVTKQDWNLELKRLEYRYGGRLARLNQRSDTARANMQRSVFRGKK